MQLDFNKYKKKDGSHTAWLCETSMGLIVAHKDLADGNAIKAEIEANGVRQGGEGGKTLFVGYGNVPVATASIEISTLAVTAARTKVELPTGFINFK